MTYEVKFYVEDRRCCFSPDFSYGFKYRPKGFWSKYKEHRLFYLSSNHVNNFHKELDSMLRKYNDIKEKDFIKMIKDIIINNEKIDKEKINNEKNTDELVKKLTNNLKTFEIEIEEE